MFELRTISEQSQKHVDIIINDFNLTGRMKVAYLTQSKQTMLGVTDKIRRENCNKAVGLYLGNKYDILLNVAKHLKCLHQVNPDLFIYETRSKQDYLWLDKLLPKAPPAVPMSALAPGSIICTKPGSIDPLVEAQRYANEISNQINPPIVKPNSSKMHDEWLKAKDATLNSLWDTKYFKPTEETPMKFVTIEKQLLVNGENVLALNAEQLTTRISELKKKQDELYDIPFSSKRIAKEIDKLDNIMSKLIKRLDRM